MGKAIKLESQKIYAIVTVYMLSFMAFLNLINSLLNMLGLQTALDTAVLYGVMLVLVLLGIGISLWDDRRVPLDVLAVVISFGLLYLFSYFLFNENRRYLITSFVNYADNPLYLVFLYSLPCYIFVRKLRDYAYFQRVLVVFSYIVVTMSIVVFFFGGDVHGKQYMTFSYNMLFQLFVLVYHKPKKNKGLHIVMVALGIFVFVFGGARGALVTFIIAVLLFNVLTMRMKKQTIFRLIVLVVLLAVYMLFEEQIASLFMDVLKMFSIESRTFDYLIQGIFFDDSNRMEIYTTAMKNINFVGHGLRGDRAFLGGSYVHNLFIELWVDFGWIFGTAVIVLLLVVLFIGIKNKHKPEHFFVLMLLSNGFLGLLLSGSYLNQAPAFFALFGFCANSILRKDQLKNHVLQ